MALIGAALKSKNLLPTLREVHFHNQSEIKEAGLESILQHLETAPELKVIDFGDALRGDAMPKRLARFITDHPDLESVSYKNNSISEEGAHELALSVGGLLDARVIKCDAVSMSAESCQLVLDAAEEFSSLVTFHISPPKVEQTEIKPLSLGYRHPNLLSLRPETPVTQKFCDENLQQANALFQLFGKSEFKPDAKTIHAIHRRMPAIESVAAPEDVAIPAGIGNVKYHRCDLVPPTFPEIRKEWQGFLAQLPVPRPDAPESLFAEDANGYTPLDNPLVWPELPHWLDQLAQNGVLTDQRLEEPYGDSTLLLTLLERGDTTQVIKSLAQNGIQFQLKELMTEGGGMTPLLATVIAQEEVAALFTGENWAGALRSDLDHVYYALPEQARDRIPNYHSLSASLQRQQRAGEQGR